jgi:hypothetical protein
MSAFFDMTDFKARMRDFLAESVPAFWSDTELEDTINDVQREIAQAAACYQTIDQQVSAVTGSRALAQLDSSYRIAALEYLPGTGNPFALRKILPRQIGRIANVSNPTPQCWLEYGQTAGIDPLPGAAYEFNAYLIAPPPEISPAPNLRPGSTPAYIATDSFIFTVTGTLVETITTEDDNPLITEAQESLVTYSFGTRYKPDAIPAGTAPTGSAIPIGQYGAWRLEISADQIIDVIPAAGNATGYATSALALAGLPDLQTNHVAVGTVTVMNSTAAFTPGTTSFIATGVTATFADDTALAAPPKLPRQFWTLILLGATARALSKDPRNAAASRQLASMYDSELRFAAFDFYEQAPDTLADMRYN